MRDRLFVSENILDTPPYSVCEIMDRIFPAMPLQYMLLGGGIGLGITGCASKLIQNEWVNLIGNSFLNFSFICFMVYFIVKCVEWVVNAGKGAFDSCTRNTTQFTP